MKAAAALTLPENLAEIETDLAGGDYDGPNKSIIETLLAAVRALQAENNEIRGANDGNALGIDTLQRVNSDLEERVEELERQVKAAESVHRSLDAIISKQGEDIRKQVIRIKELEAAYSDVSQLAANYKGQIERLRGALEEIAFAGTSQAAADNSPEADHYRNVAYRLIGTASRALKGESDG